MTFYKKGVKATCEAMGGKDFWMTTNKKHRMTLWKTIYLTDPVNMARASLVGVAESIAIDDIYSHDSPNHIKWQRYLLGTFMFTCEDVFRFIYMENEKEKAFSRWKAYSMSEACKALDLGDVDQVPVKNGGPLDRGRRQAPEDVEYDSEYEIPVS